MRNPILRASCFAAALVLIASAAHGVTIDWVTIGDPGNPADGDYGHYRGRVFYTYQIGKYEVTNAQYAEFLNAVADTDTYGLYHERMDLGAYPGFYGGITRSGSPGSYTYSAIGGRENMPVNWVTFWNSVRFVNWLHNGQPAGTQDSNTTEDGAYTLNGYTGSDGTSIGRNPGATIFLPNNNEWHKAAYYDAVSTSYFRYPTGSDTQPTCATPGPTPNTANCDLVVGDLTDVGSYTGSPSPYGTFNQAGNVVEWSEDPYNLNPPHTIPRRHFRGNFFWYEIESSHYEGGYERPDEPSYSLGFRVAMIPEPGTRLLLAFGLAGLAAAGRRRSVQ